MAYSSKIANELLATPFDDKSVVMPIISQKLTENEFCEYCYSFPKFEGKIEPPKNEETTTVNNDEIEKYEELKNEIYQQHLSYDIFLTWLNNYSYNKIYTINGNAGTGKTTFINYQRCSDTHAKWVILDLQLTRCYDEWISDIRTRVHNFEQASSKVYGCIMNKIWELVFQGADQNDNFSLQVVYHTLTKISNNYKTHFAQFVPSGRKLFDELYDILNINDDIKSKVEHSAKIFQKYIDGKVEPYDEAIINVLNIFLLILRCLFENENKFIIVFDNFERFISKDEVYNSDIDKIRLLLSSYINRINRRGNCQRSHFKFVMAVRDSTARMCGVKLHVSDTNPNNLDLNNWYDTQDIIDRKKKWYSDNRIQIDNSELIEQIIGDIRVCLGNDVKGLKLFIDPFFNYNKRLIIDFIGEMIERPSNQNYIKIYSDLWTEKIPVSRFAARSVIKGMILKELEEKPDRLFEHLKTYSRSNSKNGIGDARKILTILFNNIQNGNKNEMPLSSILAELFCVSDAEAVWKSNEVNNIEKRKSISEILYYMNSYNRRENDWIQFIDLQFKNYDNDLFIENEEKLGQILSGNFKDCMVHLMPSGKTYIMHIVASFEFFALRYSKKYDPLFTLIPSPTEIAKYNLITDLPCLQMIKCVNAYALSCIEKLLDEGEDTIKLQINGSAIGKKHFMRIIDQHKAYIENFGTYIYFKYCISEELDKTIKGKYQSLYNEINVLLKKYNLHIGG